MIRSKQSGFTLAELLIALALLGVIAALTIPKLLVATGQAQARTAIRDTVSTIEQAWYNVKMQNAYNAGGDFLSNILTGGTGTDSVASLNVASSSTTAAYGGSSPCGAGAFNEYMLLQNGVLIGFTPPAAPTVGNISAMIPGNAASLYNNGNTTLCIDYNGNAGPNSAGSDVFYGTFNSSGDFDVAVAATNATSSVINPGAPSPTAKNFFWGTGNGSTGVYPAGSTTLAAADIGSSQYLGN